MQREVASIEMELRRQKLGRRPPRRWTQVPEMLLTKYLTRPNETGQNEMLETNESILKILKAVESESTKPTPHLLHSFLALTWLLLMFLFLMLREDHLARVVSAQINPQ